MNYYNPIGPMNFLVLARLISRRFAMPPKNFCSGLAILLVYLAYVIYSNCVSASFSPMTKLLRGDNSVKIQKIVFKNDSIASKFNLNNATSLTILTNSLASCKNEILQRKIIRSIPAVLTINEYDEKVTLHFTEDVGIFMLAFPVDRLQEQNYYSVKIEKSNSEILNDFLEYVAK